MKNILQTKGVIKGASILIILNLLGVYTYISSKIYALDAKPEYKYNIIFRSENSKDLSNEHKNSLRSALNNWNKKSPESKTFNLVDIQQNKNWAIASMTSADFDQLTPTEEDDEINKDNIFNILIVKQGKKWISKVDTDPTVEDLLKEIPDEELSKNAKKSIFSSSNIDIRAINTQQYMNYKYPWPANKPWHITGSYAHLNPPYWHPDNGYGTALDFDVMAPETNSNVLAAADGDIVWQCRSDNGNTWFYINTTGTNEKLLYAHLSLKSLIDNGIYVDGAIGKHVTQGQVLGSLLDTDTTPVSDNCGTSHGTHLHLEFPVRPFTIEGRVFDAYNLPSVSTALYSSQNIKPKNYIDISRSDFNGDNKSDTALINKNNAILLGLSKGNGFSPQHWTNTWAAWGDFPLAGDFDGDKKTDVMMFTKKNQWFLNKSNGNGTFTPSVFSNGSGTWSEQVYGGDFNGDGKTDAMIFNRNNGYIMNESTNTGFKAYDFINGKGTWGEIILPGDYDGDGKTDLMIFTRNNGFIFNKSEGNKFIAREWSGGAGSWSEIPVSGDYNGDGKTDILVMTPRGAIMNISDGSRFIAKEWAVNNLKWGSLPFSGDFNGDGKTDFGLFTKENTWIVNLSNGETFVTSGEWKTSPGTWSEFIFNTPDYIRYNMILYSKIIEGVSYP